jgi:hypothetical protein
MLRISKVNFLDKFVWQGIFITKRISKILSLFIVLHVEDSSENLELVKCLWNDSLILPSLYLVIRLS